MTWISVFGQIEGRYLSLRKGSEGLGAIGRSANKEADVVIGVHSCSLEMSG